MGGAANNIPSSETRDRAKPGAGGAETAPRLRPHASGPARIARLTTVSFITAISGAIMPGPLLVAAIQQSLVQGLRGVWGLLAGHAALELIVVLLLIFGLQAVLARVRVRAAIGVVGGMALLWMSVSMLRDAMGMSLDTDVEEKVALSFPQLMLLGAAVSMQNPYFTGWWATIGMGQMATLAPRTPGEYLAFYLGHQGADVAWYILVGLIVVTGSKWLTPSIYQGLILVFGSILACLALWFFFMGVRLWVKKVANDK